MILNIYAHNNRMAKSVKQKHIELKGEINKFTIVAGDFNIPLLVIDRQSRQKIGKK